jgi:hypothetical protein
MLSAETGTAGVSTVLEPKILPQRGVDGLHPFTSFAAPQLRASRGGKPFPSGLAMQPLQQKLLQRAVQIAGSEEKLCGRLGVQLHSLKLWLESRATARPEVLHELIDLILADDLARAAQNRRQQPRQQQSGRGGA